MDFDNALRQHQARWRAFIDQCNGEDAALVAEIEAQRTKAAALTETLNAAEARANRRAAGLGNEASGSRSAPAVRSVKRSEWDQMDGRSKHSVSVDIRAGKAALVD